MDRVAQAREVDRNYDVFQRSLARLLADHRDEYALMKDGEVVGFFAMPGDALAEAKARFGDGAFSIQEITDEPIDLGFVSHVAVAHAGP